VKQPQQLLEGMQGQTRLEHKPLSHLDPRRRRESNLRCRLNGAFGARRNLPPATAGGHRARSSPVAGGQQAGKEATGISRAHTTLGKSGSWYLATGANTWRRPLSQCENELLTTSSKLALEASMPLDQIGIPPPVFGRG
jgi:hypothetical protein